MTQLHATLALAVPFATMKYSAVPATALLALSVGAVLARAAPGGGSQAGWLRHAVRAEGPAITAAPERLASTPESPLRVRDDSPNMPHDPNATSACT